MCNRFSKRLERRIFLGQAALPNESDSVGWTMVAHRRRRAENTEDSREFSICGRLRLVLIRNFVEDSPVHSKLGNSLNEVAEVHGLHDVAVHAELVGFQDIALFLR